LFLHSYAKLNLYLEVLKQRKDNYHNIKTIFERIDLCDKIILKPRPDKKINFTCNLPGVPTGHSNLAYRSAKLLQDTFNIDKGADIKIIKRIPVAAGLGGGSGNAATVLIGLNELWKLKLSRNKLLQLARKIGSDVSFFIYNCSFAKGEARGDRIKPLRVFSNLRLWHILVVPKFRVSTPRIYKKWDKDNKTFKLTVERAGLTRPKYNVKILILALRKNNFFLLGDALFNSLEQVTTKLYPQITRIREKLIQMGVKSILMSGSGPAIFGVVSSRKEALSLCRQLKRNGSFGKVFVTRTQ
jgi:4-diphosphocytidyl-2-C-methyl-D-erythritol kinase